MEMSFRKFIEQNVPGYHNDGPGGAFVTSDQSGSETFKNTTPYHPSYELMASVAPHSIKYGKIVQIKEYQPPKKTQVQITLHQQQNKYLPPRKKQDKYESIFLNTDQYRTMQKMNAGRKPKVGDMITVALLRLPGGDSSPGTIMGVTY